MRGWWAAIRADRRRASRFGLFWLLMCLVTACAWFVPALAGNPGGMLPMLAGVLLAAGAGLTAAPMGLSGALAGGLVVTVHMLYQTACRALYQRMYPLAAIRGDPWARHPGWTGALAEALVVLVLTFALGAAVGYLAARCRPHKAKG